MATSRASAVRAVKKYADGGRFPQFNVGGAADQGRTLELLKNRQPLKSVIGLRDPVQKTTLGINPIKFNTGTAPGITQAANTASALDAAGAMMGKGAATGGTPKQPGINWSNRLANTVDKLAPYASNIANAFTSPARPEMGAMVSAPKLAMPNYDATRADINASESAFGRSADQSLDANNAAIAKLGARAQTLSSMNKVAEGEGNARAGVANQQASLQLQTNYANTQTVNQYKNDLTTFANTAKSAKLANISNAADKYVAQKNVKAQGELDLKKQAIMSAMYDKGVYDRAMKKVDEAGAAAGLKFAKGGMLNQIDATTMMLGRKLKNGGRLTNYTK
jgi:hypothetical protein